MNKRYDIYVLSPREKVQFYLVGYGAAFLLMEIFYDSWLLALAGGFLCVFFLPEYKGHLQQKRQALLVAQFRDMLVAISASVAAGRPMNRALQDAEDSLRLVYKEDSPLVEELQQINHRIAHNRESEEILLKDLAQRSGLEDLRAFAEVYALCRHLGGDMTQVITETTAILTEKMRILREIHTLTAQKQLEGRIITIMPIGVIACLNIFSPDYLEVLYTTLTGRLVMTIALGGIVFAHVLTGRILAIEI